MGKVYCTQNYQHLHFTVCKRRQKPAKGCVANACFSSNRLPFLAQYYLPHLRSFYKRANSLPMNMLIPKLRDLRLNMCDRLFYFARIFGQNGEISLFKYYRNLCFLTYSATD